MRELARSGIVIITYIYIWHCNVATIAVWSAVMLTRFTAIPERGFVEQPILKLGFRFYGFKTNNNNYTK